ncbi:hypothetical protein AVEN_173358-1 [Araneus ventricosus]|uniref:Transposase Tc1-like domain-containing protein n=1 Tax=Araneus ventricosus TaxID=182803 RepID=A0A4Y2IB86_ARAVE|nr:hypothetical protein AVEN_173358-1 [Araneus ventricosus]
MSCQTVSRRLHKVRLFTRRPVVCVPLSPAHVRARLHWTHEHRSCTPEQWGHVLFTDESLFNIQNDSRRAMIWREPGTRYRAPKRPLQRWRVTCLGRYSNERPNRPLRVRWGSVTAVRYRDEILHPLVLPFIAAMGTDAIFMDDNAHPHRERLVWS